MKVESYWAQGAADARAGKVMQDRTWRPGYVNGYRFANAQILREKAASKVPPCPRRCPHCQAPLWHD